MYETNFIKGNYGNTIIMNSLMNLDIFDNSNDKNITDEDRNEIMQNHMNDLYMDFKHEIQSINSKITQNLSKYENFLHNYNRMRIVVEPGYLDGFSAYVDSNYTYLKRNNYKTNEEYKKVIINEYIIYAEEWRDNYVHDGFTDQDFDDLLKEYANDLNTAFNEIDYDLVKLGKDYGMAILDQNSHAAKYHFITDKDVEIAKDKLNNQNKKEIDNDWER